MSTGAGPVSFYAALGGGRRSRGSSSAASYERQLAAQQRLAQKIQRAEEALALAETFERIVELHRVEFAPAARPVVPPPHTPDRAAIYRHYEKEALSGLSVFRRAERAAARQRAAAWADAEAQRQWAAACAHQAQWQRHFDDRWQQLNANVPGVVMETLNEAFEDNEAPSAAVGVAGDEVSLVVLVPSSDQVVPDLMPAVTPAGNPTLKRLPQRGRSDYYKAYVCGQMLVTIRESFAVAPALASARVVVLRNDGRDAFGRPSVSCILAASFYRADLDRVHWHTADAVQIVNDVASQLLLNQRGRSSELAALDLVAEQDLVKLVEVIDLGGLATS